MTNVEFIWILRILSLNILSGIKFMTKKYCEERLYRYAYHTVVRLFEWSSYANFRKQ